MHKTAILDQTRKYRYLLSRQWGLNDKNYVSFILLNPSTADEKIDDPTIKKCIKFAKEWNYDGIYVTNLFALRSTNPKTLKITNDPVGPDNDKYILDYAKKSKLIIAAWGNNGTYLNRNNHVLTMLQANDIHCLCLDKNKSGNPKHPLYCPLNSQLKIFQ